MAFSTSTAARWTILSSSTGTPSGRSEEHTSELQSHLNLVCRLLLEKKKIHRNTRSNRQRIITKIDGGGLQLWWTRIVRCARPGAGSDKRGYRVDLLAALPTSSTTVMRSG